jgi:nitroreductase
MTKRAMPGSSVEPETVAEIYHRLTSYSAERHWLEPVDDDRLELEFIPLSAEDQPAPFKEYPEWLPWVRLPDAPEAAAISSAAVLGDQVPAGADTPLDVGSLSAILSLSARVTRRTRHADGTFSYFRAASSAGNRHPLEVYVCARRIGGLADGIWHYEPRRHSLTMVGPPPRGDAPALVISGVPWRSCWKYAERGYRYLGWDCGTLAAQAVLAARSRGLDARLETAFQDRELSLLTGVAERDELPLVIIPLAAGVPAVVPSGRAERGYLGARMRRFRMVTAVHEAGDLAGAAAAERWRQRHGGERQAAPARAPAPEGAAEESFDDLIRRRGSARRFDPRAEVAAAAVEWIAGLAAAPLPWDAGTQHDALVIAHGVAQEPPGAYRLREQAWERVRPADRALSYRLCVAQELGRDAAFLLFFTPSPGPGVARDARAYRAALIAAGFGLGRLYAAAAALGFGCTGLTFVDSLLPGALGVPTALAAAGIGLRA